MFETKFIVETIVVHKLEKIFEIRLGCSAAKGEDDFVERMSQLYGDRDTFRSSGGVLEKYSFQYGRILLKGTFLSSSYSCESACIFYDSS